jgi:hypothetical protein
VRCDHGEHGHRVLTDRLTPDLDHPLIGYREEEFRPLLALDDFSAARRAAGLAKRRRRLIEYR